MNHSQVAVRYAKSLYLLAKEKNLVEDIKNDIELVESSFSVFSDLKATIDNPVIKPSIKKDIIEKVFSGKVNEFVLRFLLLVIENKRDNVFADIFRNFSDIYRKDNNIKKSVIVSVDKLSEDDKKQIKQIIEEKFKSTIEIEEKTNPEIVGGLIVRIEDKEYDFSILGKLNKIHNEFQNISL
jgi:F-type H+-transporting ATPase subunit delta